MQRVVLGAASRVVVVCERSLAGLRDTIRLQTLVREHAPQTRLLLVEAGASGERATVGKAEFEKAIGKSLDATPVATTPNRPVRRPMPASRCRSRRRAARSCARCEQLIASLAGAAETQKRKIFGFSLR